MVSALSRLGLPYVQATATSLATQVRLCLCLMSTAPCRTLAHC